MKNTKAKIFVIMMIVGLAFCLAGFSDAMLLFKGKKVDLNKSSISDFKESALVDGEVDFVYGPFTTYEESHRDTDFFIVGSFTADSYENMTDEEFDKAFYVVLSTSDKDMKKKLTAASDEWTDYLTDDEIPEYDVPEISIDFEGRLSEQPTDKEYKDFYNDTVNQLSDIGIEKSDLAKYRIEARKINKSAIAVLLIGVGVFLIGFIGFIMSALSDKKHGGEFDDSEVIDETSADSDLN